MSTIESSIKEESGIEKAVEESVLDYCRDAEESGPGLEIELQELGWEITDDKASQPEFEFYIRNIRTTLDRLFGTKFVSFNKNLELT